LYKPNWEIQEIDINMVFLNDELEAMMYMEIPEGMAVQVNKEKYK